MPAPIEIFISAGEDSGDLYGALLIEALRQHLGAVEFFGCGGEKMRAAGCETVVDARSVSMVGIVEVIPGLLRVWKGFWKLVNCFQHRRPALAVLIDFPDFNLRLAKKLKRAGVRVVYFVAPQVWAWRSGRLKALRRDVDRLLCIFPFEQEFFRKAGVKAEFVGHPLVGRVAPSMTAFEYRSAFQLPQDVPLIALLPGSRRKEIELNLPRLLAAARKMGQGGHYGFVLAAASPQAGETIRRYIRDDGQRFYVVENHTYDAVAHASAAIVASGTATIVTALLGTPMVVVYRVTTATYWLGRRLVRVPFYSMVNIVAGREIVPEFIQDQFEADAVAAAAQNLIGNPEASEKMRAELRAVVEQLRPPSTVSAAWLSPADLKISAASLSHEAVASADAIENSVAATESILRAQPS